jgi:hypothetical protein
VTSHFDTIDYLLSGNARQRLAHDVLTRYDVLTKLQGFDPLLVGTIPIQIDIESSDLDIVCCYDDQQAFFDFLVATFGSTGGFKIWTNDGPAAQAVVASFRLDDFDIEIFGQAIPTKQQYAYRHMLVEHKLLTERGEQFRQQIITLKRQGYKTEPAFGVALALTGNPYEALLTYGTDTKTA